MIYTDRTGVDQALGLKQIIPPPSGFEEAVDTVFGKVLAVSPDFTWLAIGTPNASGVTNKYLGEIEPRSYLAGEIVLSNGKLWRAINDVPAGDGSSVSLSSQDWEPATIVDANPTGRGTGFTNQGMVSLYKYSNGQWENNFNFVSPPQAADELFGSAITFGVSGTNYYMAVSAVGSLCDPSIGASTGKGRVYLYYFNGTAWSHLENSNYLGIYGSSPYSEYPKGSIVWSNNDLWQAQVDAPDNGGLLEATNSDWLKIDPVSTQNSLPTNVSLDDDGSTLAIGLLNNKQLAELVKDGDNFGHSLVMSRDGSILVVGTPNSDGQFFTNYRGLWSPYQEYVAGDVVKYQDGYHQLSDLTPDDASTQTSRNEPPDQGNPWNGIGDSTYILTGKTFIYKRNSFGNYYLAQTITSQNLEDINDSGVSTTINSGDQFGTAIDIDASGTTLVVSAPLADINKQNQGVVYVFKNVNGEFRLTEKLQSYEYYTNEYFGSSVSISAATERIAVGAKNARYAVGTTFDSLSTVFDFY